MGGRAGMGHILVSNGGDKDERRANEVLSPMEEGRSVSFLPLVNIVRADRRKNVGLYLMSPPHPENKLSPLPSLLFDLWVMLLL